MSGKTGQPTVERSMSNLLFQEDPDIRLHAALQLGGRANGSSAQRLGLGP